MTQPLYYKDLLSGKQPYTENELGRKGESLAHLVANHIPVPPFFVIPPDLYTSLVKNIFKDSSVASLDEFRKKIQLLQFSPQVTAQIAAEYTKLSGFGKAWVAARSSIVAPEHVTSSFSGLLSSKLNIRGDAEIEAAIKEIFLSLFSDRSYDYLKRNSISYGDIGTAVIIQKMVQAEVSGIMYTYDPITTNQSNVSIEAVFGLGDVLSEGSLNPDIYTVSKDTLEIVEKKIVPQEWMKVRKMGDTNALEHLQKISISQMWQYAQKLDDSLVRELTKLADTIEKALGEPQVIEWAMERGSLYILQAKPLARKEENTLKQLHDKARKITSVSDIDTFSKTADDVNVTVSHEMPQNNEAIVMPQETLLFTGTPASVGVAYGEVALIADANALTADSIEVFKKTLTKKSIIVTNEFTPILEPLFFLAGGVITNFGGANSDVAIVTREAKIPAIVGTRIATSYLQSGALVKVDGGAGAISRVDFLPEENVLPQQETQKPILKKKKKLKKKSLMVEHQTEVPTLPKQPSKHHDSPIKLFLKDSVASTHSLISSPTIPSQGYESLMLPISEVNLALTKGIKKLKSSTTADLFLTLSDSPSFDALLATKRSLAARGIRRSKRIKFIISLGTVYGVMNSKSISDLGVDGVLFDVPAILSAYRPGAKEVDAELWKLLLEAMSILGKQKSSYVGLRLNSEFFTIPLRKELLPIIRKGVTSLVFTGALPNVTEEDIAALEQNMMATQLG